MIPLAPLQRRSIVDEAFDALRAQILHGTWAPGDRLPTEAALQTQLGVSRSTIREALNRLASAGLIEIPHGGSKRVRDWRDHAGLEVLADLVVAPDGRVEAAVVRSILQMRAAIAPDVARLAAEHRTAAQAEALLTLAAFDPSAALESLLEAQLVWWRTLILASGNLAYRLAFNTLRLTHPDSRPVLLRILEPEVRALSHYNRISAAVTAFEPQAAERACRELIALGNTPLFAALEALEAGG